MVQVGTVGGTPLYADFTYFNAAKAIPVLLSSDYLMMRPPGALQRPGFVGAAVLDFPRTVASGTRIVLHEPEALALVAAGAGSVVS
jgi:hypothetical protein